MVEYHIRNYADVNQLFRSLQYRISAGRWKYLKLKLNILKFLHVRNIYLILTLDGLCSFTNAHLVSTRLFYKMNKWADWGYYIMEVIDYDIIKTIDNEKFMRKDKFERTMIMMAMHEKLRWKFWKKHIPRTEMWKFWKKNLTWKEVIKITG